MVNPLFIVSLPYRRNGTLSFLSIKLIRLRVTALCAVPAVLRVSRSALTSIFFIVFILYACEERLRKGGNAHNLKHSIKKTLALNNGYFRENNGRNTGCIGFSQFCSTFQPAECKVETNYGVAFCLFPLFRQFASFSR